MPGALEIPTGIAMAIDAAARKRDPYDGVVALGCVISGETYHFEIVSNESARGLAELALTRQLPIGNGILTVENESQAVARAGGNKGNKGTEAARAALAMVELKRSANGTLMGKGAPGPKDARKANRRGAARLAAVQALYQMDIAGAGLNEILAQFESHWLGREVEGAQYLPAEAAFFRDIVSGVVREQRALDPLIDEALSKSWPLKRIEAILRAALRAGAYELAIVPTCPPVPLWPSTPTSPQRSWRRMRPGWSTPCSINWRGRCARANSAAPPGDAVAKSE